MSITPPAVVVGAPRPPLPYGLFSVLAPREGTADRWEGGGILFESVGCPPTDAGILGAYVCDPEEGDPHHEGLPKSFEGHAEVSEWTQFHIYQSHVCSPIGNPIGRSEEIARERLALFEERLVEEQLWSTFTGLSADLTGSLSLTDAKADVLATFATLEQDSSDAYGTQGIFHLPRAAALFAIGQGALEVRQNRLFTVLGTPVVAGAGYPGATDAAMNIYWTPQLVGYRSEIFTSSNRAGDLLDRGTNDLHGIAERSWVIGFDTSCGIITTP